MAENKPKSRKRPAQPSFNKFAIYDSLSQLNLAFRVILIQLERLDDHEVIKLHNVRLFNMRVQEIRSGINHAITDVLKTREERDWAHYGKQRMAEEKRLAEITN